MVLFRRDALAGQSFAIADEIEQATRIATAQLNHRASHRSGGVLSKHDADFADSFVTGFK